MKRSSVIASLLLAAIAAGARPSRAAQRELVIGNEACLGAGAYLPSNMEAFVRRVEEVVGWPRGSLRGKAFAKPAEALAYIRKNKVAFAILPVHQFVQARKELKLEVLGRAVGLEGADLAYWGVSGKGPVPYQHIEEYPGLRLATTDIQDLQWLNVMFEANVDPAKHFKLMEVPSDNAAIDAVASGKADVALVYESAFRVVRPRIGEGQDFKWVYTSGGIPPFPILSVGKFSTPGDRQKFQGGLEKICRDKGGDACARMNFVYIQSGRAESYRNIIQKYDTYKSR